MPAANYASSSAPCVLFAYHEMGYACMETLLQLGAPIKALFTHRDDPNEQVWWRSCAQLALRHRIPVHFAESGKSPELGKIESLKAAVIYSFYYRNLLPDRILKAASIGAFNLHGSLLPKYRGRAPVNWVLVNGERETGVTLHHMVERADAGDIVAQKSVEISDDDTALTLFLRLVPLGASLIREFHPQIVAGSAPRRPQAIAEGSYFGRRRPEDGRIDWNWPARRIFNLVRAVTQPYPGAYCEAGGRRLLIWSAQVSSESGKLAEPGTILDLRDNGSAEIAAGDGTVCAITAQFEGERERKAAEALRAVTVTGLKKLE